MTRVLLLIAATFLTATPSAFAGDPPAPQKIQIETGRSKDGSVTLAGRDAWQQLLVTGHYANGQLRDVTGSVQYESQPAGIVQIDATGMVTPIKEGRATISVTAKGTPAARVQVTVTHMAEDLPINFANQIVPIFTKFGCNAGGCHGKAAGQNGFKLSLLGFEPEEDYEYLVK